MSVTQSSSGVVYGGLITGMFGCVLDVEEVNSLPVKKTRKEDVKISTIISIATSTLIHLKHLINNK